MDLLKKNIIEKAHVKTDEILDVKSFLNAKVDIKLMQAIGKDFADQFKHYQYDLFVTVESSGIAPSVFASLYANKPLVIIKKSKQIQDSQMIQKKCYSFTKKKEYYLTVPADFIKNKRIILIDDFLAKGAVLENVSKLIHKADGKLVASGICITKGFQDGYRKLTEQGFDIYSQAFIKKMNAVNNTVIFG